VASDAILTAPPPGAGRVWDYYLDELSATAQTFRWRNNVGTTPAMTGQVTPTGGDPGPNGGGFVIGPNGLRMGKFANSANRFQSLLGFASTRPSARFVWPLGRLVFEGIFSTTGAAAMPATVGMYMSGRRGASVNLLGILDAGFGLLYDNGVITYVSAQAGVLLEKVNVSALAGPPLGLNKFTLVAHQATFDAEASVDVIINDRVALTRKWGPGTLLPGVDLFGGTVANVGVECYMASSPISTSGVSLLYDQVHIAYSPDVGDF
jgi:hypothetical protein